MTQVVHLIYSTICDVYGLTEQQLLAGRNRRAAEPEARQLAVYCMRKLLKLSYPELSKAFGYADHTTTAYAVRTIEARKYEPKIARVLEQIEGLRFCKTCERPFTAA